VSEATATSKAGIWLCIDEATGYAKVGGRYPIQVCIMQYDESGVGDGYRIAGPKYGASGSRPLRRIKITPDVAVEIRRYLDKVRPTTPAKPAKPALSRPVRLHATGLEGQLHDDSGALWVLNDTGKPGSNPPEAQRCSVCGGALGAIVYMRQTTDGPVACLACVEIVP